VDITLKGVENMRYFKVNNLFPSFSNQADYKGLNIDHFVPGSQCYSPGGIPSYCVIATTEEDFTGSHPDLIELSEAEYMTERKTILDAIAAQATVTAQ